MPLKALIPLLLGVGFLFVLLLYLAPRVAITAVIMGIGFTMVWKTPWWIDLFGRNPWAEQHLTSGLGAGAGGSWLFYKLLGIVTMIGGFFYLTGGLQTMLVSVLGTFFGAGQN